jgi:hypothetical protein
MVETDSGIIDQQKKWLGLLPLAAAWQPVATGKGGG